MLERKIRQFLIHSFLYYKIDESLIEDNEYDSLVTEVKNSVQDKENYIYKEVIQDSLGSEGSAFTIRKYPPEIVSAAFHLLYNERYKETKSFTDFLKTYGYNICN
tara:strand:+ start:198 stop:512 length:315 start_codon:yes stop_codon:yes gene_type:complete